LNIALPAILLFAVLLPGFVFHRFYQAREVRAADLSPFGAAVLTAIAAALLIDICAMGLATWLGGYHFQIGALLRILAGGQNAAIAPELAPVYARLDAHPMEPVEFFALANALALLAALAWRFAIWRFGLDRPTFRWYCSFRPSAPWHYLFMGIDATEQAIDGVVVSAVVPFNEVAYLYTGLLEAYFLTDKGELDRVVLSSTSRRRIEADKRAEAADEDRFYPVEGDYFVIRASEYVTLNIKYLVVEDGAAQSCSD
jgi:hypothetical protein